MNYTKMDWTVIRVNSSQEVFLTKNLRVWETELSDFWCHY